MKKSLVGVLILAALCHAADEKRDKKIVIPVTESELKAIEKAAKEADLSVPDFVRVQVMKGLEATQEPEAKKSEDTGAGKETSASGTEESPLEGWKVVSGPWKKEEDGVNCCRWGFLQWEGEVKDVIEIDFCLTVREWDQNSRVGNSAGIVWNAGDMEGDPNPQKPRNLLLVTSAGDLQVFSQPARPGSQTEKVRCVFPLDKPIRIRGRISRDGIQATVGKEKISASIPSETLGKLQFHVGKSDAVFSNVKVKSK